ncbi:MAG: DUF2851 family protein [Saprospiraceae bacterium]|nr:DUF2851 family protein [Saprospiraceae bacterium]
MKEDLLHYFWGLKILTTYQLHTTRREPLKILAAGQHNLNQGPDFLYAKVEIGGIIWIGHVEIHIRSSDWNAHGHEDDPHYKNVILHVVWEADKEIFINGSQMACLEIKNYLPTEMCTQYERLMNSVLPVPCHEHLHNIPQEIKNIMLEKLMIERFENKTTVTMNELNNIQYDWEALFFRKFAYYLVSPVNRKAMESLMQHIPYALLSKYKHDKFLTEALLFGVAGFLNGQAPDNYTAGLKTEFDFMLKKHQLHIINPVEWKFLRMRPAHFPGLRLAQLAALLHNRDHWFSQLLNFESLRRFCQFFSVELDGYWKTHYHPGKKYKRIPNQDLGIHTLHSIFINAACPVLFAYGQIHAEEKFKLKALRFMEELKAESNRITQLWKSYNFALNHAGHSQAGIQLYQNYCVPKRCTNCMIGSTILKSGNSANSDQVIY